MIRNWLKIFIYQLRQSLLFSVLNTLGLAIGIAGIVFAILYWNEEHSYNAWNPEKDKVFQVVVDMGKDMRWAYNVAPLGPILKEKAPEVESILYYSNNYFNEIFKYNGKKELVERIFDAQATFFSMFPFEFVKGSAQNPVPDNNSVALSEKTAERIFGSVDPMGKIIQYAGRDLVVKGVYRIPGKSSVMPDAVINFMKAKLDGNMAEWGNFNFGMSVKLKDPADRAAVEKKIDDIFYEHRTLSWAKEAGMTPEAFAEKYGNLKSSLEPLSTVRLHATAEGYPEGSGNYQFLLIMAGLSVLILILSIVNYVNLATANAIKRAKEVGVRKIIGASKGNIVWQFLFETTLLSLFAVLLSLAIVELSLPYYNEFLNKELVMVGTQFYWQIACVFVAVVVVAGIFPAMYVANFESLKVLKGNFGRSKSGVWLRNGMLILQFSIASFFIIGSYIVYSQVNYISNKDLGFKGNQVMSVLFRFKQGETNFDRYKMIKQELV